MSHYVNGPEDPERLVGALHDRTDEEYAPGLWRPAVPLPFYGLLHVKCWECKRRFWGSTVVRRIDTYSQAFRRYERHYRAVHIEGRPYLADDGSCKRHDFQPAPDDPQLGHLGVHHCTRCGSRWMPARGRRR